MICSKTKELENAVKIFKHRTKICDQLEKAKERVKLVDEDDNDSPPVKRRKGKIRDDVVGDFSVFTGLKCVEDDVTVYDKPQVNRLMKEYFSGDGTKTIQGTNCLVGLREMCGSRMMMRSRWL
ncbi:hypothetical protein HAX54_041216 [Datura stramonium]|uniref:Uncharacterized protein n=1 Tax=Datura stramonium TaxID=4076 RepID=A0ABS8VSK4_DATST|nr:hypothetical protein [Datura stramonium]